MPCQVIHGDCLAALPTLDADSIDACVTDPPYHLTSIVKRFGGQNAAPTQHGTDGAFARGSRGFMGQTWDGGDIAFRPETWAEVFRVLKPGAHLVAFSGTRTYHRMACAIEDAGFEVRDQLAWVYGSGFPKSHNVALAIDKTNGIVPRGKAFNMKGRGDRAAELDANGREYVPAYDPATDDAKRWSGWGTALKPAWEPIVLARKPLSEKTVAANVLKHGCGAINVDSCRISAAGDPQLAAKYASVQNAGRRANSIYGSESRDRAGSAPHASGRWPANLCHDGSPEVLAEFAKYPAQGQSGAVTGLEPSSKTNNVYGAFNGRPATSPRGDTGTAARFFFSAKADAGDRVIRDIEEVVVSWISELGNCQAKLQVDTGQSPRRAIVVSGLGDASEWSTFLCGNTITDLCRRGSRCTIETETSSITELRTWSALIHSLISASTAGANCATANGGNPARNAGNSSISAIITLAETVSLPGASHATSGTPLKISVSARRHSHPTCKPIALMRWLVRMVTPPGGIVLDPFAGSGTTGMACMAEGFRAALIEQSAEYVEDIKRRLAHVRGDDTPLFHQEQRGMFA